MLAVPVCCVLAAEEGSSVAVSVVSFFVTAGNKALLPGEVCGGGLTDEVATELGLLPGTPVGTSLIDAHAGGMGMVTVLWDLLAAGMSVVCLSVCVCVCACICVCYVCVCV